GLRRPDRCLPGIPRRIRREPHRHPAVRLPPRPCVDRRDQVIAKLILRRLAISLVILLAVSLLVFFATLLLPCDPALAILGQQATPERIAAIHEQMHLDEPAWQRYFSWLGGLLTGDLGTSVASGQPIAEIIGERARASVFLMVVAAVI